MQSYKLTLRATLAQTAHLSDYRLISRSWLTGGHAAGATAGGKTVHAIRSAKIFISLAQPAASGS